MFSQAHSLILRPHQRIVCGLSEPEAVPLRSPGEAYTLSSSEDAEYGRLSSILEVWSCVVRFPLSQRPDEQLQVDMV